MRLREVKDMGIEEGHWTVRRVKNNCGSSLRCSASSENNVRRSRLRSSDYMSKSYFA